MLKARIHYRKRKILSGIHVLEKAGKVSKTMNALDVFRLPAPLKTLKGFLQRYVPPPHISLPMNRWIGERTIQMLWRACELLLLRQMCFEGLSVVPFGFDDLSVASCGFDSLSVASCGFDGLLFCVMRI
ncbi:hypothetical protein TNCV_1751991 [Trichonephila clavipes]|nr:hypothetical protein TNCV_1751991 [Trichonephila clavipes]